MGRAGFTEKKYYDFGSDTFYPPTNIEANEWVQYGPEFNPTGVATKLLFAPEQGVKLFQRIGRRAWINDIKMNFSVNFEQRYSNETTWTDCIDRFVVVILIDKHVDGTAWSSVDAKSVMQADMGNSETFDAGMNNLSFTNTTTWGRYRVLKKLTFKRAPVDNEGLMYQGSHSTTLSKKWKHTFKKPLLVNFNGDGAGGDEGNVSDIGIRMIVVGTNRNGSVVVNRIEEGVKWKYMGRVGFYDHK